MLFYDKYYSIITDKIDHPDGKKARKQIMMREEIRLNFMVNR